jgi:hypothetical protein
MGRKINKMAIGVRNVITGKTPYARGKAKVNSILNSRIKEFKSVIPPRGIKAQVVSRRAVNRMIKMSKGRPRIASRANQKLLELERKQVFVRERGLGKVANNPHLEFYIFDKLTKPTESASAIYEVAKKKRKNRN